VWFTTVKEKIRKRKRREENGDKVEQNGEDKKERGIR
jgi:hypothetical protein